MLNKFRIIPRFEIKSGNLIKGIKMEGLKRIDNFLDRIIDYQNQGADEIIIDDIVASLYSSLLLACLYLSLHLAKLLYIIDPF